MKLLRLALFLCLLPFPAQSAPKVLKIDDIADLISSRNLSVLSNAERVYQAKESIGVARGNLLPKLNLWRLVSAAVDVKSTVGLAGDIVPFLVPANWWQVKQAKLFAAAQERAYHALWANEVMTARALFLHAELDQSLMEIIENKIRELKEIRTIVRSREILGGSPEALSKQISVEILALEEDVRSLKLLLAKELNDLGFALGADPSETIVLQPTTNASIRQADGRGKIQLIEKALDASPELHQFQSLIDASKYAKKQARFTFLGVSSLSRGVIGGVFDSLPVSDGLGFGTSASVRVTQREKAVLELQRKAIQESLKRTVDLTVDMIELDSESLKSASERRSLSESVAGALDDRLKLGDQVDAFELLNSVRGSLDAETNAAVIRYRGFANLDRLSRLCFEDAYSRLPRSFP